jgi:hypothetical protein
MEPGIGNMQKTVLGAPAGDFWPWGWPVRPRLLLGPHLARIEHRRCNASQSR